MSAIHLLTSLVLSWLLYFLELRFSFLPSNFAQAFAYGSAVIQIYLRLLELNFSLLVNNHRFKALLGLFSSIRMFLLAAIFAYFILKLKFNILALASAFLVYKLILVIVGFYRNASYSR